MTASIGFISVRKHPEHGFFGGYLIVNRFGRPLEFHCTMPVKPSRAQELLYGPTLDDFVSGEQIARALVTKAKLKPTLSLADCTAVLAVAQVASLAIATVANSSAPDQAANLLVPNSNATDHDHVSNEELRLVVPPNSKLDGPAFLDELGSLDIKFEIAEPFQRVLEALLEAHPIAKAA